jgi:hypothetical protein
MSKQEEQYRIKELERKVAGMQEQITSLKTETKLNRAELAQYKKTNDMAVRDLTIRDAVRSRGIPASVVAKEMGLSKARISQIVNKPETV